MLRILLQEPSSGISAGEFWIIVFTGFTALAGVALVVITWFAYQHGRLDAGARSPIEIKTARTVRVLYPADWHVWTKPDPNFSDEKDMSLVELFVHNRSSVAQVLVLESDQESFEIIDPNFKDDSGFGPFLFDWEDIYIPAHTGGNVMLKVCSRELRTAVEDCRKSRAFYLECKIVLNLETESGHRARFKGKVPFRRYEGADTVPLGGISRRPKSKFRGGLPL